MQETSEAAMYRELDRESLLDVVQDRLQKSGRVCGVFVGGCCLLTLRLHGTEWRRMSSCKQACARMFTCAFMHARIRTLANTCMQAHAGIHRQAGTLAHACKHLQAHRHAHTHAGRHTRTHMQAFPRLPVSHGEPRIHAVTQSKVLTRIIYVARLVRKEQNMDAHKGV